MGVTLELLAYHGRPCPYCATTMRLPASRSARKSWGKKHHRYPDSPTRDHVIPRSRMPGMGTLIVCYQCNADKKDRTIAEWAVLLEKAADRRASTVKDWMKANAELAMLKIAAPLSPTLTQPDPQQITERKPR